VNRFGLIAIWVAATALTTVLAWQIVAAAGEQVSPGPLVEAPIAAPDTSTTAVSTTLPATSATSTLPTTSSTPPGSGSTTPNTDPGSTSPGITASWQVKTIPTDGGTVVVSYRPGEVVLDGATPAAGFTVDVDKGGPPEVRVEFESESTKIEVRVQWDGKLVIDLQADDHED
jgi:hypothetical protein